MILSFLLTIALSAFSKPFDGGGEVVSHLVESDHVYAPGSIATKTAFAPNREADHVLVQRVSQQAPTVYPHSRPKDGPASFYVQRAFLCEASSAIYWRSDACVLAREQLQAYYSALIFPRHWFW